MSFINRKEYHLTRDLLFLENIKEERIINGRREITSMMTAVRREEIASIESCEKGIKIFRNKEGYTITCPYSPQEFVEILKEHEKKYE